MSSNVQPEAVVDIHKLSELLYIMLCRKLGNESIIQIRREIFFLQNLVDSEMGSVAGYFFHNVGSRAEGFRITTSDHDLMIVLAYNVVVNNTAELSELSCAKSNKTIITMETQYTKPGYVRLILETDKDTADASILASCLNDNEKLYISSTKFREYMGDILGKEAMSHGPCSKIIQGIVEHDFAVCLSCTSQPTAIQNWVMRCKVYNWPDSVVLEQCISLGCQLAPVGSKESIHENLEWRISFILMENRLLQSLSHCQFMCYGLLKIYLREVLGSFEQINDLVSSYFMKTVLLWEIQTNFQHNVGADSLLRLFRKCLQRLHTWVKTKKFPNFFIPENNMFENRINDDSKNTLQDILELLFSEHYYGLYRCKSIDLPRLICEVLKNEIQSVVVSVNESISETKEVIERITWFEVSVAFHTFMFQHSTLLLRTLELILTKDSLTDFGKRAVQTWISEATVQIAMHSFKDIIAPNVSPDIQLEKYNSCCHIFRTNDYKGCVTSLYLATLMYITGRYQPCLDVIIEHSQQFKKLHKVEYVPMVFVSANLQLTELRLEIELPIYSNLLYNRREKFIFIHSILYTQMLSVLCNYHLDDVEKTETAFKLLSEFRSDMEYMNDGCIQEMYWQILGICAEILEKYDEAYQSYVRAYKLPRVMLDASAPLFRVLLLIYKRLPK